MHDKVMCDCPKYMIAVIAPKQDKQQPSNPKSPEVVNLHKV